jgi:hypothetical protein
MMRAHIDSLPRDVRESYESLAFRIYLLDHDSVVDHRISFSTPAGTDCFDIVWGGRIALTHVDDEPKYSGRALPADPLARHSANVSAVALGC